MDGGGLLAAGAALLGAGAFAGAAGQRVAVLQHPGRPRPEPHLQGGAGLGPGHLGEVLPEGRLLGGAANTGQWTNGFQLNPAWIKGVLRFTNLEWRH